MAARNEAEMKEMPTESKDSAQEKTSGTCRDKPKTNLLLFLLCRASDIEILHTFL